jgi:hypothetical protein
MLIMDVSDDLLKEEMTPILGCFKVVRDGDPLVLVVVVVCPFHLCHFVKTLSRPCTGGGRARVGPGCIYTTRLCSMMVLAIIMMMMIWSILD